jgi:aspartyl protease family protein
MRVIPAACLAAAAAAWAPAHAQSVALQGMLGSSRVVLVVDGSPKTMAVGDTFKGVKLLSAAAGEAVVEAGGKRQVLRMGETPGGMAAAAGAVDAGAAVMASGRIVLRANRGGHFLSPGQVNGKPVTFMVDTGATMISMGVSDAERMNIDYKTGRPVQLRTANGLTVGWQVRLNTVRIGEVELYDQEAVVSEQPMPYLLLGNSVLNRFTMRRDHEQMVLERR